ncbi:MAG: recombinase family protein [Candidatus Hydrogenedentes bacterium]|nr:recombinase family protein [Candidatus Hydrogenedentota bacterium]
MAQRSAKPGMIAKQGSSPERPSTGGLPLESGALPLIHLPHGAKVKRGQLTAVQQGRYGTGPAPYGYRRGREGEKPLMVDDREAEVVRIIYREYLNTRSTGKVVNYLHSKGIFTRKGNRWSRQAVAIILSNRTYRGRVSYGNVETQGLHDPIIEPALFYKANALKERKKRRRDDSSWRADTSEPGNE